MDHELIMLKNELRLFLELSPWFQFHLSYGYLVTGLPIVHYCIDLGNAMTYIANYKHLIRTVDLRPIMIPLCHFDIEGNHSCDDLCCTLRNQFLGCREIMLKTLINIIYCH